MPAFVPHDERIKIISKLSFRNGVPNKADIQEEWPRCWTETENRLFLP